MWRRILFVVSFVLICGYLYISWRHVALRSEGKSCSAVEVRVLGQGVLQSSSSADRVFLLMGISKARLKGCLLDTLHTGHLEKRMLAHSYVKRADVFKTVSGVLCIEVEYRSPLVRVFNRYGDSFYLDRDGFVVNPPLVFYSYVLAASGNIDFRPTNRLVSVADTVQRRNSPALETLFQLYRLASFVEESKFWSSQIEQVYVTHDSNMQLIPRVGSQVIEFGNADYMEEKFRRLQIFYEKALPSLGWNRYEKINVKYKGQVVCTPKSAL